MKDPVTRTASSTRRAQSWHANSGGQTNQRYRAQPRRKNRRQRHQMQRLLAVCGVIAGAYWLFLHTTGAGSTTSHYLGRVLGVAPTVAPRATSAADASHLSGSGATTAASARTKSAVASPARTAAPVAAKRTIAPVAHAPVLPPLPASALLQNDYQVYETWNNCGPASLSMALSYFGIHEIQVALGQDLRPYQNSDGDNDTKNVTMDQLVQEAKKFGFLAYHRPDGTMQLLKEFVANGLPVIIDTDMTTDDDIGHYRVVKGYDDATGMIIQDDSMQGHNVHFSYADMNAMWRKYNYEYMVLVPKAKQALAEAILGKDFNTRYAWQQTVRMDEATLALNPADVNTRFNLSVALYYVGAYQQSVAAFEQVQNQLTFRTLWYNIEPLESYYQLGDYQKVFSLSDTILNDGDRAFSELYILRGQCDLKEGNIQAAKAEFQNAVYYNVNMQAAKEALATVSQ